MIASTFRKRLALAVVSVFGFAATVQAQSLTDEQREKIKAATVYIVVMGQGQGGSGSGFVVKAEGDDLFIVTNNHVIDFDHKLLAAGREPSGKAKANIRVIFDSGTAK